MGVEPWYARVSDEVVRLAAPGILHYTGPIEKLERNTKGPGDCHRVHPSLPLNGWRLAKGDQQIMLLSEASINDAGPFS